MTKDSAHLLERAGVPQEMKKAHMQWLGALFYPESTRYFNGIEKGADMGAKIASDARNGDAGAMLMLARRANNEGQEEVEQRWLEQAVSAGSSEAAFLLGHRCEELKDRPSAFKLYRTAQQRRHLGANWALANLCRASSATELGVPQAEYDEALKVSLERGEVLMNAETFSALVTGAHPVQYKNSTGIPWGTGTFFIVEWKGRHFAFTARHVIDASQGSPEEANFLVPDYDAPVPFRGFFTASAGEGPSQDDDLDVAVWELDIEAAGKKVGWQAWRLDHLWKPAAELAPGDKVFAVGYPNTSDRVDIENNKMLRLPLVVRGALSVDRRASGLLTVECAEFSVDPDGVSGGPAFAMFRGVFHYVGMVLEGGGSARRLHFLDASRVIDVLDRAIQAANAGGEDVTREN